MRRINQPGTYALIYHSKRSFRAVVGRLGAMEGARGYWIYVGSAFGPGGLHARLCHHLKPARRPHWHLDYIKAALQPEEIWVTIDANKREHEWVHGISEWKGSTFPVAGFGATDCACPSHLIFRTRRPGFSAFRKRMRQHVFGHGPIYRMVPSDLLKHP